MSIEFIIINLNTNKNIMGHSSQSTNAHTYQRSEVANYMDASDTYNNQHGKNNIDVMDIGAGAR